MTDITATFYEIQEDVNYKDLPNGRKDVGTFYVVERTIAGIKNIALFFSGKSELYIADKIWADEKTANQKAAAYTVVKLSKAIGGDGED